MSTKLRIPRTRARPGEGAGFRFNPSRRGWVLLAVAGILLTSLAADAVASVGRVRSGVRVGTLELGGASAEEAERRLGSRATRLAAEPVRFTAKDEELTVTPEEVGYFPDVDRTLARAMEVGRSGNVAVRAWHRLRSYFVSTDVGWVRDIDNEAATTAVDGWAERFDDPGREAGIEADGTSFTAVEGESGRRLDKRRTTRTLVRGIETWPRQVLPLPFAVEAPKTDISDAQAAAERATEAVRRGPITITSPQGSLELTPEEVAALLEATPTERDDEWRLEVRFSPERTSEKLAPRMKPFEREPKNASFSAGGGSVSVVAGTEGLTFDAAKTAEALTSVLFDDAPRTAEAAFEKAEPELTTAEAEALNITERVATFTTNHACCQPRVKNIHRMADIVDGALVRPGATFSLNQYVGKRTESRGFVLAPMIYDGEYKDDVGGGVSQFATTFFNAVWFGGYDIGTYKAHSYYISRYPPGREATISWPHPDLKFRNDTPNGILIKTGYSNTGITVSFYGNNEGRKVSTESGERRNFTDPPEQRKANSALPPGRERVVQSGSRGFTITVTRTITYDNGKSKREPHTTVYKPEPRIIEYGPGTPEPETPPPGPQETPAPQSPTPHPPATPPPSTEPTSNP